MLALRRCGALREPLLGSLLAALSVLGWACAGDGQRGESAGSTGSGGGTCAAACASSACCLASHTYASAGSIWGNSIQRDANSGDVLVAGSYTGPADAGLGALPSPAANQGGTFVVRYDGAGSARWQRGFAGVSSDQVAYWSGGWAGFSGSSIIFAASFSGDVDFGCGVVHGAAASNAVLVKLTGETGACVYSRAFGPQDVGGVRLLAGGDVVVTGNAGNATDLGCGALPGGKNRIYVSRRRSNDGSCVWSRVASTSGYLSPVVEVDTASSVYVATTLVGATAFAGDSLSSAGPGGDALLLKYDRDGSEVWGQHWGHPNQVWGAYPTTIALTPDQNVWFAGSYQGSLTFGSQTLPANPKYQEQGFVAGVTPTGAVVAATALFVDDAQLLQSPLPLAADASGSLFVAAQYSGNLHVGGRTVSGNGTLLAKLDASAGLAAAWTKVFAPSATPNALQVDGCGDLLLTGSASPSDLGCGLMNAAGLFWARLRP